MSELAGDWVTLDSALVWILTRDQKFRNQYDWRDIRPGASIRRIRTPKVGGLRQDFRELDQAWHAFVRAFADQHLAVRSGQTIIDPKGLDRVRWQAFRDEFGLLCETEEGEERHISDVSVSQKDLLETFPASVPGFAQVIEPQSVADPADESFPDAYMNLADAAAWVASQRGTQNFYLYDRALWIDSFKRVMGAVADHMIEAIGILPESKLPLEIESRVFSGMRVVPCYSYIERDLFVIKGEEPYVQAGLMLDEFSTDEIIVDQKPYARAVRVRRRDVAKLFPKQAVTHDKVDNPASLAPAWEKDIAAKRTAVSILRYMVKTLAGNDFPDDCISFPARRAYILDKTSLENVDPATFKIAFDTYRKHQSAIQKHARSG